MSETPEAEAIIAALGLKPHPEGGWYAETFRDPGGGARGHSTAIYYLLKRGERSHWHRLHDAVEVWHHYAGAPLKLMIRDGGERYELLLGDGVLAGERPQAVVPKTAWQAAQTMGEWTLVGCTVAPGFDFATFELAPGWEP